MKLCDIHLRDPFVFAEDGVYYLYGTRRGFDVKVVPWKGLDVYTSADLIEWSEPHECFTRPDGFWADRDFFAPEVYKYNGAYYILLQEAGSRRDHGSELPHGVQELGFRFLAPRQLQQLRVRQHLCRYDQYEPE